MVVVMVSAKCLYIARMLKRPKKTNPLKALQSLLKLKIETNNFKTLPALYSLQSLQSLQSLHTSQSLQSWWT